MAHGQIVKMVLEQMEPRCRGWNDIECQPRDRLVSLSRGVYCLSSTACWDSAHMILDVKDMYGWIKIIIIITSL